MRITAPYLLGGVGLYAGVAAAVYSRLKSNKCPESCKGHQPQGQPAFDSLADTYDQQIGWDERLMGVLLLRRWLIRQAQGDILEVSAGTGRNLPYYSKAATSVTMTDTSKEMLWHARQKHDKFNPSLPVTFCLADAQKMVPLSDQGGNFSDKTILPSARQEPASKYQENLQTFSLGQFDTIIDTFGLCSHEDPIAALKQMAAVCKPGGQIILLQHGKATWDWLNSRLDDEAPAHHAKWGCWWNRDILQIVRQAGLHIDSCSRWHFGTTYVIQARPAASGNSN